MSEQNNPTTDFNPHRLLSRSEVAELFGVSPSTVTRWAKEGKLPVVKTLGGHRRYKAEAVMELARHFAKERIHMEDVTMSVPAMYADHHVLAVRQALMQTPGVEEVQASSAFKTVHVRYDANQISPQIIAMALQDVGYAPAGIGGISGQPDGNGAFLDKVPVSTGDKDPAWVKLGMRTVETNQADIQMSGEFRMY